MATGLCKCVPAPRDVYSVPCVEASWFICGDCGGRFRGGPPNSEPMTVEQLRRDALFMVCVEEAAYRFADEFRPASRPLPREVIRAEREMLNYFLTMLYSQGFTISHAPRPSIFTKQPAPNDSLVHPMQMAFEALGRSPKRGEPVQPTAEGLDRAAAMINRATNSAVPASEIPACIVDQFQCTCASLLNGHETNCPLSAKG